MEIVIHMITVFFDHILQCTAQHNFYLYSFLICDIMFYIVKSPWHIFVGQAKTYGADWHTIF